MLATKPLSESGHVNTSLLPLALGDPRDDLSDRSAGGLGLLTTLHPPIALAARGDIGALVSGPISTGGVGLRPAGWCFPAPSDD